MDPTAALECIRAQLRAFYVIDNGSEFAVSILADHVAGLDEWLTQGGALPTQWATKTQPTEGNMR